MMMMMMKMCVCVCELQISEVCWSAACSSQPFSLGNMWWAGSPQQQQQAAGSRQQLRPLYSPCAGLQEAAETPWTAPPLCRTTVFLRCPLGTGCADLSKTSARVRSGGWNSPQTPHRIPDPFPGLTHGRGSATSRRIDPSPLRTPARLLFPVGSGGFFFFFSFLAGGGAVSPPTTGLLVRAQWSGSSTPPASVGAGCSSTELRLQGAPERRKEREALCEGWGALCLCSRREEHLCEVTADIIAEHLHLKTQKVVKKL